MGNCFRIFSQIVDPIETRLKHAPVGVPDYVKFQTSTIVTGKEGTAPGELYYPYGVAIDEATHQIFVANCFTNRIEIFSETGEYICQLGVRQVHRPRGIATYGDSVYVSCNDHTISKFSLIGISLVRKIGGRGSNNGQFEFSSQLTTDPIGRVFVADTKNDRICIYDTNLNHLRNITHESMSRPFDIKISRDRLYVLCPYNSRCIHVLTLEGEKLHSLINSGRRMDELISQFFCLDSLDNFVISDNRNHSIRIFSPRGKLLHTIGREGFQPGLFFRPRGIAITPNGRLVCLSKSAIYDLQIFC